MPNFATLGFIDTWALAASLRQRLGGFEDFGEVSALHARTVADGWLASAEKWPQLKNAVSRIRRQPPLAGMETGYVGIERLAPQSIVPWSKHDTDWLRLHVALVTNPLAWIYCGVEALHMEVGWVNMVDIRQPTTQVNFGEWPRLHLVLELRRPEPEGEEPT